MAAPCRRARPGRSGHSARRVASHRGQLSWYLLGARQEVRHQERRMTPEPKSHVSAIDLDLHQMGDLDPERSRALLSHLAECERCRARKEELASSYGEFSADVFPRTAPKLRTRPVANVVPLHRRPLTWAPALVAAAAILLFAKTGMFSGVSEQQQGDLGVKGSLALSLSASRAGQVFAVDGKRA